MTVEMQFINGKTDTIPTILGAPIIVVNGAPYIIPFPTRYIKDEKHNLENCDRCKKYHQTLIVQMGEYWDKFPYCCKDHKKLLEIPWFRREDFKGFPKMVADKIMFTYLHIVSSIDRPDWEVEIENYIAYTVRSFGQFPDGYGGSLRLKQYLEIVRNFINNYKKRAINKPKLERFIRVTIRLKKYIEPSKKNPDTEMNILIETYNKWFRSFPFDLPFFSPLKDAFAKTLPIMAGKMTFNPYLNEYYGESQTLSGLLDFLAKVTTQILDTIDTTQLVTEEYISNETKYNLDLYKKHHLLNQSLLLKQYSDGEKLYMNTIKRWLENEKIFIAGILPFIKTIPSQAQKSKAALPNAFLLRGA